MVTIARSDSRRKAPGLLGGRVPRDVDHTLVAMSNVSNRFEYEVPVARMNSPVLVHAHGHRRCRDAAGLWPPPNRRSRRALSRSGQRA
ncbi:hypothetical protein BN9982_1700008 [Mycobacterium tuberculosis]|nr:hypothetical protein BN9982_1700008 [Mycobacterium tuberculosis]